MSDHYRTQRDKVEEQAGRLWTCWSKTRRCTPGQKSHLPDDASRDTWPGGVRLFAAETILRRQGTGGFGGSPKFPGKHEPGAASAIPSTDWHGRSAAEWWSTPCSRWRTGACTITLEAGFTATRWMNGGSCPTSEKMLIRQRSSHVGVSRGVSADRRAVLPIGGGGDARLRAERNVEPEGGYYSTQDADSEGEEGKFFVWRPAEVDECWARRRRGSSVATTTSPQKEISKTARAFSMSTRICRSSPKFLRVDESELMEVIQAGKGGASRGEVAPGRSRPG